MMLSYIKWIVALIFLIAFIGQDVWIGVHFYSKGKDSVFTGVLSGVASNQKKDDSATQAALLKAEQLGTKVANLEAQKNDLVKKLKASVAANPRSSCVLSDSELRALQAAADSTK